MHKTPPHLVVASVLEFLWEREDSNLRRQSHLIYSQAPLTAQEHSQERA